MRRLIGSLLGVSLAVALTGPVALAQGQVVPVGDHYGGQQWAPVAPPAPYCPAPLPNVTPLPPLRPAPGAAPGAAPAPAPGAAPSSDIFSTAPPSSEGPGGLDLSQARGTEAPASAAETLLGDLAGGGYYTTVVRVAVPRTTSFLSSPSFVTRLAKVPAINRGSFKITDNESPRPLDRVFIDYNYYNRVGTFGAGDVQALRPDLNRETFGFEKTFLDGVASFGLRVPIFQTTSGDGALKPSDFGDLTLITKVALFDDRDTGNLISGGLALTVPTGPDDILADGSHLHSTLFQPYLGYIWNAGRLYVEGFSAIIVPTDSRDVTLLTSDVGLGYRAYAHRNSDAWLTEFTPTIEMHLTDPLNHRGVNNTDEFGFPDIFVLTSGAHLGLGRGSTLTLGFAVPLTGPRPFDFEAIAQFNWRF